MLFTTPSRRSFIHAGLVAAGAAALPLPRLGRTARAAPGAEPHFFLLATIPGGMDGSYLFDARPLALTQAGRLANYLGVEPELWSGRNGQTTWATQLTAPLKPFRDDFSVVNGVVMAASFDGHDQNLNYLLTGNPFGGESFVPHLNRGAPPAALDYVQSGFLYADLTNTGASMPLTAASAHALVARLRSAPSLAPGDKLLAYLRGRMRADALGVGRFAAAARLMDAGAAAAPGLDAALRGLDLPAPGGNELEACLQIATRFFKAGITPCAAFALTPEDQALTPDTHGADQAKASGKIVGGLAAQIAAVFATLKATPYDKTRSMLDVTTVVVASEFSRTMRQLHRPLTATGTDHNPLTNTVLIGGKGVLGGLVVGESDTRSVTEAPSGAHQSMDPAALKLMGRPFDFASGRPRQDRPGAYDGRDYLLFASVANTVYELFGVPAEARWQMERGGGVAPVLATLLA